MTDLETATNEQLAESLLVAMNDIHHLTQWLPYIAEAVRRLNFDRQPLPVTVTLDGDPIDVEYWMREFMQRAEFKGDLVIRHLKDSTRFTLYPRAIND